MSNKKCTICAYNFTNHKRLPISCENCEVTICLNCFEKWLIDPSNPQIYLCCKQPINDLIIWRNLTKKGLKLYFEKLCNIELEEQKKLMIDAENKLSIKKSNKLLVKREKELRLHLKRNPTDKVAFQQLFEVSEKILNNNIILENKDKIDHNSVKCLQSKCTGIMIKNKCSVCEIMICLKCKEVKENDHICDPNLVKNVEEMKRSTKPCPNCSVPIHKIDGCDQMFCVQCHSAFSWNSGKIDKSNRIHNPHYFDYIAKVRQNYLIYDDNQLLNDILNKIISSRKYNLFYIPRLIQECAAIITALSDFIFNQTSLQTYREQSINHIIKFKNKKLSLNTSSNDDPIIAVRVKKVWLNNIKHAYVVKKFLCTEVMDILTTYLKHVKSTICVELCGILDNDNVLDDDDDELKKELNYIAKIYNTELFKVEKKHKISTKTKLLPGLHCSLVEWDRYN